MQINVISTHRQYSRRQWVSAFNLRLNIIRISAETNKADNTEIYTYCITIIPLPHINQWHEQCVCNKTSMKRVKRIDFAYLYPFNSASPCPPSLPLSDEEGQIRTDDRDVSIRGWDLNCKWEFVPASILESTSPNSVPLRIRAIIYLPTRTRAVGVIAIIYSIYVFITVNGSVNAYT